MKIQTASKVYSGLTEGLNQHKTLLSLQGSARSAKTYNTLIFLIVYLIQHPGIRLSIVRKTLPAIKGSVLIDFKEILMFKFKIWDDKCFNKTELIYKFPNGSWVEFFSTDDEQKIRGRKRHILFVNEANEISEIEWQQLKMRTTLFSIIDYNPSFSEDHWIESENKDKDTYHFISTYKDNPFLEQKIVDDIEKLRDKNKSLWQIYGLGLRSVIEGRVFNKFEIVDSIPEHIRKRFTGIDFGFSNDPTAIVEVAIDGEDMYVDEICYRTKMLTKDIIDVLKEHSTGIKIVSESADPRLVAEIYHTGLNIHAVTKYQGSVNAGISKMQEFNIKITKRSFNLIKEFNNYVYSQDKEGKYLNVPIDAYNHCFVGDTKIETNKGKKNIKDITINDKVLTSQGFKPVLKTFNNGYKQVNNYMLQFGTFTLSLCCTSNHLIKTAKGWKQISQLESGTTVYLSKNLTGKHIDFTQKKDISQGDAKECITLFGCSIMDKLKRVIMFITKMKIHGIIELKTWNVRKSINTSQNTGKIELKKIQNGFLISIRKALKRLKSGINQRMDMIGTPNIQKNNGTTDNQKNTTAYNAGLNTNLKHLAGQSSVQTIANHNTEDYLELITNNGNANTVGMNLHQTNILPLPFAQEYVLVSIIKGQQSNEAVYDIMIDEVHEYFANNILVHNCIDGIRYVVLNEIVGKNRKKTGLRRSN